MHYTVKEVSDLTGVTIRTLHWYDEIGLLKPESKTESNYRLYSDNSLNTLQQILFFKELGFELDSIKNILESENYNEQETLNKQKELLILKQKKLEKIINLITSKLEGECKMSFNEFNDTEYEKVIHEYKDEAQNRWGHTDAYKESMEKSKKYSKDDWAKIHAESDAIYLELAENMDKDVNDSSTQALIKKLQDHYTKYFYTCTNEILLGLGEMYIADERFKKNIDKYKDGLTEYLSAAIKVFCTT